MPEAKRLLVLCVDVDNDLYEKAKVKGPIIGRKRNLEAATKFSLADPGDTDGNTIFQAVKTYDQLVKQGYKAEVATITGSARLGYYADREIVKQLEKIIDDFKPEACAFISDGASDEQILPLIQSRVKVNSVTTLIVKQSKELEKTYFVLLEKLKEPQFARTIFGIPGLLLILAFLFQEAGVRFFIGIFGIYLVLKGFGVEEAILRRFARAEFSIERVSFIFLFASAAFIIISIYLAIATVSNMQQEGVENIAKIVAYALKDFLLLFPIALLLIIGGNLLESWNEKKKYLLPNYAISSSAVVLFWLIANNAADWVIGKLSFADFFYSLVLTIAIMYLVIYLAKQFKRNIISAMKLEGREVYTDIGGFLGKISGVDRDAEALIVQTRRGQKIDLSFESIANIGDKLIIKY
ncbi:MAG TPA: DUF373 family protein [Candidatus Norongarragalinales archaeon]|nr:DUF373 family protein [Candidatus Norongarragalinales archaeon]